MIEEWLEPSTPESEEELKDEQLKDEQPNDENMTQELTQKKLEFQVPGKRRLVDESGLEKIDVSKFSMILKLSLW